MGVDTPPTALFFYGAKPSRAGDEESWIPVLTPLSHPGAPHGFHADYRASYRKEAAEDAWNQMRA